MRPARAILLAMLLVVRPHAAAARGHVLEVPRAVESGEALVLQWNGLPAGVEEVELELSLDGGRWLRISPELEASEGRFAWRVPPVASAHARLRLRAGGQGFERELGASPEFQIGAPAPTRGARPAGPDWWHVGEHAHASGWEAGSTTATLDHAAATFAAEGGPDAQGPAARPLRANDRDDLPLVAPTPANPVVVPAATRVLPLRR